MPPRDAQLVCGRADIKPFCIHVVFHFSRAQGAFIDAEFVNISLNGIAIASIRPVTDAEQQSTFRQFAALHRILFLLLSVYIVVDCLAIVSPREVQPLLKRDILQHVILRSLRRFAARPNKKAVLVVIIIVIEAGNRAVRRHVIKRNNPIPTIVQRRNVNPTFQRDLVPIAVDCRRLGIFDKKPVNATIK